MLSASVFPAQRPSAIELSRALASFSRSGRDVRPQVRSIRCHVLGDPTEFSCSYQQLTRLTQWRGYSVIVAIDGDHWVVIEQPHLKKAD
jgi:hypothetical protein